MFGHDGLLFGGADGVVLDGVTGAVEQSFSLPAEMIARMPAAGDSDLDGFQEIIIGSSCYSHDGELRWSSDISGTYGHWSAILDVDDDLYGEVAMVGNGELAIYDTDGTELFRHPAGTGQPGPPCVADFDGDGSTEVAVTNLGRSDGLGSFSVDYCEPAGAPPRSCIHTHCSR